MLILGTFVQEPRGTGYASMIACLAEMAERALLVERTIEVQAGVVLGNLRERGERLRVQLQQWCVSEDMRSAWPGTQLFGGTALVREYALSEEVVLALQTAVEGLYEWQGGLPEDLALLRPNGEALMFAISHERDAGLSLYDSERERLLRDCPALDPCIEWGA